MKNSIVCSLYEGNYEIGLGALINSLLTHSFEGDFYIGYKGKLPLWINSTELKKVDEETFLFKDQMIKFILVKSDRHLTNYKPEFLKEVIQLNSQKVNQLFYFDPDICVKCDWSFFERWANYGIALCEDINSPMPVSHPIRKDWEHTFENLKFSNDTYINGGFIGLPKRLFSFLDTWIDVQNKIENHIGNLNTWNIKDRTYLFQKTDQDALNISIHINDNFESCSLIGQEAMDFKEGGYIMSHSLAQPKPWNKKYITRALKGFKPNKGDLLFLDNLNSPISICKKSYIRTKKLEISIAKIITKIISN